MSHESRREDQPLKPSISFCSPQETVTIRSESDERVQTPACVSKNESLQMSQLPIKVDMSILELDDTLPKPRTTRRQRKLLISLLGNPYTPENEWLKICHLLGPNPRIPHLKPHRRRTFRALAVAMIVAPLVYCLGTHIEKTFVKSVNPSITAMNTSWEQYRDSMQCEISRSWTPSLGADDKGISLIFKVNADGTTGPIRLGQSDRSAPNLQNTSFRTSCVRAILSARFQAMPLGLAGKEVECVFRGRQGNPETIQKIVSISGVLNRYSDLVPVLSK